MDLEECVLKLVYPDYGWAVRMLVSCKGPVVAPRLWQGECWDVQEGPVQHACAPKVF